MDSSNDLKKCFAFCTKPALAFFKAFLAFDGSNFFFSIQDWSSSRVKKIFDF